jgi:dihydropteroate synthase
MPVSCIFFDNRMGFKNTLLPVAASLQAQGRIMDLSEPAVMGILNATPDSFYTGTNNINASVELAGAMLAAGASILDIGGASTRPGAEDVSVQEETDRVLPLVEALRNAFPDVWLSVDTFHASVAETAVSAGVSIVNDITAGSDPEMLRTVTRLGVPYIAMHMQGTPKTMQQDPQYENVVTEVFDYLKARMLDCRQAGINEVILDPGFGFGKTVSHNFQLLSGLGTFRALGKPILAGISRKSMVCKPIGVNPKNALNGSTALHMAALREGASILRVHDVREAMECIILHGEFGKLPV